MGDIALIYGGADEFLEAGWSHRGWQPFDGIGRSTPISAFLHLRINRSLPASILAKWFDDARARL